MRFNTETYPVAGHWLPALLNGDETGLDDADRAQLAEWVSAHPCDHYSPGVILGFCRDDISGLLADCIELDLMTGLRDE